MTISYKKKKIKSKFKRKSLSWWFLSPPLFIIFSTPSFKRTTFLVKILLIQLWWSLINSHDYIWAHSMFWNTISATDPQEANCFSTYSAQQCIQLNNSLTTVVGHYCELYRLGINTGQWLPRLLLWAKMGVLRINCSVLLHNLFSADVIYCSCTVSLQGGDLKPLTRISVLNTHGWY